ncbi:MAG: ATP-grasp domain-containing protein [Deltaproteobacteria bacterium]|nr:ATP-grasp domain-containing protein [Deltaproteobacteria bacterium]
MRVIVCDASERSALAAVRSLGRAGHEVHVAATRHPSLASVSRYSSRFFSVSDPMTAPRLFAEQVLGEARRIDAELIVPLTDASCFALGRADHGGLVVQPDIETLELAADKYEVFRLARELGLDVPRTIAIERADSPIPAELSYPLVVKPRRSRVLDGETLVALGVTYAANERELRARLKNLPEGAFPVLLQTRVTGDGVGYFALARDGVVLAEFFHRRLRELPPSGGVSVLREAMVPDAVVRRHSLALIERLAWTGPIMVEFKRDAEGRPNLMEINGRFWGSLQLAIDAGVDFPALLAKMKRGEAFSMPGFRPRLRTRHLLGDIESVAVALAKGSAALPAGRSRWAYLREWLLMGGRAEIESMDDPRPALHEYRTFARKWGRLISRRLFPRTIRGIIHSHTTFSHDGALSVDRFADHLEGKGLAFVAITEHENSVDAESYRRLQAECRKLSRPGFVLIPGIEFATPRRTHILGMNVSEFFDEHDPAKIVRGIHERGGIAVLAHPDETDFERDPEFLSALDGAEAWNAVHDSPFVPSYRNITAIDEIRRINPNLKAFGGVDFHRPGHYRAMRLELRCEANADAILDAFRRGDFRVRGPIYGFGADAQFGFLDRLYIRAIRLLRERAKPVVRKLRRALRLRATEPTVGDARLVAHAIETGNPGGAERVMLHLVDRLPANRFVSRAVLAKPGWLDEQLSARNVPHEIHPVGHLWNFGGVASLARMLRNWQAGAFVTHELYLNVQGAIAARMARVRHVAVVHGNLEYASPWFRRAGYHLALLLGSRIIAVSFAIRDDLAKILRVPRHRIGVIHNGVVIPPIAADKDRAEARTRLGVTDEPTVALVGSLYPVKGHAVLLAAMPMILAEHPRATVFLIGRGRPETEQELRRAAESYGDRVRFLGFRDDVDRLLPGIDVLAVPSLYEGLSLAVCEAMAAGVPVVASRVGGNPEIITDGDDGLLVPVGDHAALAHAICRLLADPDGRAVMGARARETATTLFSMERMIAAYAQEVGG